MKITSPLGILAIAATCKQWNRSNDIDFKEQARQSLVISSGLEETAKAVDELFKALSSRLIGSIPIEDEESKFRFALNISAAVLSKACREEKLWEPFETSLIKTACTETAEYLRDSFKAGHFEKLPMPEFGREMPDQGEEGTVEGTIAAAKIMVPHLPDPGLLTMTFKRRREDGLNEEQVKKLVLPDQEIRYKEDEPWRSDVGKGGHD